MVSVIIPTANSEATLPACLAALVPAAADGLVREVIVVDHGSGDATLTIADAMGCEILHGPAARGARLKLGAEAARGPMLLFLHADTVLESGFEQELRRLMDLWADAGEIDRRAATFRRIAGGYGARARRKALLARLNASLLGLSFGEHGLFLSRTFYEQIGGHAPFAVMEDVDLTRRIGARRLITLRAGAEAIGEPRQMGAPERAARGRTVVAWLFGADPGRLARRLGL